MPDAPDPVATVLAIEAQLHDLARRRDAAWDALDPYARAALWLPSHAIEQRAGTLSLSLDDLDRYGRSEGGAAVVTLPADVATWDRLEAACRALDTHRAHLLHALTIGQHLVIEERRTDARSRRPH